MSHQIKTELLNSAVPTQQEDGRSTSAVLADYFTTEELAHELGVSFRTIMRWRLARHGPPATYVGRRIYYKASSVRTWLAARERPAVATATALRGVR